MDPLDTMTVADWRRVYERSQERVTALLAEGVAARRREAELVDRLRRREEESEKLRRDILHWRTEATDAQRIMDRRGELVKELKAKITEVSLVRAWTNEDGKSFVFTDDLLIACGAITPEALSRAREIAGEEG